MKVGRTPPILPPRYPAEALAEATAWLEEQRRLWEEILDRLAIYIEKAARLRGQITSAMIYPVAVLTIAMVVVGVILWKVIPTFAALFSGLGAELPLPTRLVVAASEGYARALPGLVGSNENGMRRAPYCSSSRMWRRY